jgi:hypothetical protein
MASKLNVFVDADVIFAGAASPSEYSASNVVLRMAEITLINAITSAQANLCKLCVCCSVVYQYPNR